MCFYINTFIWNVLFLFSQSFKLYLLQEIFLGPYSFYLTSPSLERVGSYLLSLSDMPCYFAFSGFMCDQFLTISKFWDLPGFAFFYNVLRAHHSIIKENTVNRKWLSFLVRQTIHGNLNLLSKSQVSVKHIMFSNSTIICSLRVLKLKLPEADQNHYALQNKTAPLTNCTAGPTAVRNSGCFRWRDEAGHCFWGPLSHIEVWGWSQTYKHRGKACSQLRWSLRLWWTVRWARLRGAGAWPLDWSIGMGYAKLQMMAKSSPKYRGQGLGWGCKWEWV